MFVLFHLEPLTVDKRITDTGYAPVQQKTRNEPRLVIRSTAGNKNFFTTPTEIVRQLTLAKHFVVLLETIRILKLKFPQSKDG